MIAQRWPRRASCPRQRAGDVGQSSGLGEARDLRGGEKQVHARTSDDGRLGRRRTNLGQVRGQARRCRQRLRVTTLPNLIVPLLLDKLILPRDARNGRAPILSHAAGGCIRRSATMAVVLAEEEGKLSLSAQENPACVASLREDERHENPACRLSKPKALDGCTGNTRRRCGCSPGSGRRR